MVSSDRFLISSVVFAEKPSYLSSMRLTISDEAVSFIAC